MVVVAASLIRASGVSSRQYWPGRDQERASLDSDIGNIFSRKLGARSWLGSNIAPRRLAAVIDFAAASSETACIRVVVRLCFSDRDRDLSFRVNSLVASYYPRSEGGAKWWPRFAPQR